MDDDEISLTSTISSVHSESSDYEIDEIIGKRNSKRGPEYLVKWRGYDNSRATWEPPGQFANKGMLAKFERDYRLWDAEKKRRLIEDVDEAIETEAELSRLRKERRQRARDKRYPQSTEDQSSFSAEEKDAKETLYASEESKESSKPSDQECKSLKRKHSEPSEPDGRKGLVKKSALPVHHKTQQKPKSSSMTQSRPTKAKHTKSEPHIPKYLSGQKGALFRNLSTQNRVRKLYGAEPVPDRSALKLLAVDRMDEEMEKAQATRAADPLGLNSTFETVGDRKRARDELKAQELLRTGTSLPDELFDVSKVVDTTRKHDLDMHTMPPESSVAPNVGNWEKKSMLNGRFCYWGELLIQLNFDKNSIGDVRFHGFGNFPRSTLLHMKKGHSIYLNAQDVWDKQTYINMCTSRSNEVFSKGCVIGFDDTDSKVKEMANYLQYTNCIALVWHPDRECVYIFYSSHSPDWQFFEQAPGVMPAEHELRIICRSYFDSLPPPPPSPPPPTSPFASSATGIHLETNPSLNASGACTSPFNNQASSSKDSLKQPTRDQDDDGIYSTEQGEARKALTVSSMDARRSMLSPHAEPHSDEGKVTDPRLRFKAKKQELYASAEKPQIALTSSTNTPEKLQKLSPKPASKPRIESVTKPQQKLTQKSQEAETKLHQSHTGSISDQTTTSSSEAIIRQIYRTATQWPGTQESSIDIFAFYLLFPESHQQELNQIRDHIDKCSLNNYIFAENHLEEVTFNRFSLLINCTPKSLGIILIHYTFKDYTIFPQLASLLKGPSQVHRSKAKDLPKLNVFAVSLEQPIPGLWDAAHLQRMFPHFGVCILVTEGAMTKEPLNALAILKWFKDWRQKRGSWKICLRPKIRAWLVERMNIESDENRKNVMFQMLETINDIISDSFINTGDLLLTPDSSDDGYESIGNDGDTDDEGLSAPLVSVSRLKRYGQPPSNPGKVSQLTKDEHVLVEWFAGWAHQKASRHRAFTAVTTEKMNDSAAWNHIEIITPARFMEDYGIVGDGAGAKVKGGPPK